jgi:simple sugar transport system ATP-binding protein
MAIAEKFALVVDPDARIGDLSIGERQRVEILKALYRDARILILDEPTAVLTQIEAERLFSILRGMAKEGLSLVFISHKLGEVMVAADRVVVLRAGKVVAERDTRQTSRGELAELMVGRRVSRPVRQASKPGPVVLSAEAVDVVEDGRTRLEDISFEVRAGEVLGIIGVAGNGQTALGRLCAGLAPPARGRMLLDGHRLEAASARVLVAAGVGRIPEDRLSEGIVGEMAVWENAVLERVREPRFSRHGLVDRGSARTYARELIERFDIRGAAPDTRTRLLSGGNMQKLILGRNLAASPRLLIANQPTRGLDEGAIAAIHRELLEVRDRGVGILLISEDLDEVVALADRVQAIYKGRLSPPVATGTIGAKAIGLMMAGMWEG